MRLTGPRIMVYLALSVPQKCEAQQPSDLAFCDLPLSISVSHEIERTTERSNSLRQVNNMREAERRCH